MVKMFCKVLLFILMLPVKLLCTLVKLAFHSIVGDKSSLAPRKKCCSGAVALGAFVLVLLSLVAAFAIDRHYKHGGCDCDYDCDCDDDECDCDCQ